MASSILYPRKTPGGGEERGRGWRLVREEEEEEVQREQERGHREKEKRGAREGSAKGNEVGRGGVEEREGEKERVGEKMRTRSARQRVVKSVKGIKKDREGHGMKEDGHTEVGHGEKDERKE